jgi:hypothetical protein
VAIKNSVTHTATLVIISSLSHFPLQQTQLFEFKSRELMVEVGKQVAPGWDSVS